MGWWALLAAAGAAGAAEAPAPVVHRLPASERTYELLVPPVGAAELARLPLVVYLHGSGQPRPERARKDYWPLLGRRKCLFALTRSKGKKMWLAGEEKYVTDVIDDIQTRYSVDGKRVCLLGVGGGGQAALFLADHLPERFRAVIVVSTSPVTIRGRRQAWFYPNRKTLKTCPYFVVNHITQGASLMYWRQVRAKLTGAGASISILPVTGKPEPYQRPPKALGRWLDEVLAGRHPKPLPDPQKAAVAKMLAGPVAALSAAIDKVTPAPAGKITKAGPPFRLTVSAPPDFQRSKREDSRDSTGAAMTQIRIEHKTWPITVRAAARATEKPLGKVLAEEAAASRARGILYQVYSTGALPAGGRQWKYRIGSITYPDRRRGWVSALFLHAAAPVKADPKSWLTVTVTDETQQPQAKELAAAFRTVVASISAAPAPAPATAPAPAPDKQ